jgi:hypothetical protein
VEPLHPLALGCPPRRMPNPCPVRGEGERRACEGRGGK